MRLKGFMAIDRTNQNESDAIKGLSPSQHQPIIGSL